MNETSLPAGAVLKDSDCTWARSHVTVSANVKVFVSCLLPVHADAAAAGAAAGRRAKRGCHPQLPPR